MGPELSVRALASPPDPTLPAAGPSETPFGSSFLHVPPAALGQGLQAASPAPVLAPSPVNLQRCVSKAFGPRLYSGRLESGGRVSCVSMAQRGVEVGRACTGTWLGEGYASSSWDPSPPGCSHNRTANPAQPSPAHVGFPSPGTWAQAPAQFSWTLLRPYAVPGALHTLSHLFHTSLRTGTVCSRYLLHGHPHAATLRSRMRKPGVGGWMEARMALESCHRLSSPRVAAAPSGLEAEPAPERAADLQAGLAEFIAVGAQHVLLTHPPVDLRTTPSLCLGLQPSGAHPAPRESSWPGALQGLKFQGLPGGSQSSRGLRVNSSALAGHVPTQQDRLPPGRSPLSRPAAPHLVLSLMDFSPLTGLGNTPTNQPHLPVRTRGISLSCHYKASFPRPCRFTLL